MNSGGTPWCSVCRSYHHPDLEHVKRPAFWWAGTPWREAEAQRVAGRIADEAKRRGMVRNVVDGKPVVGYGTAEGEALSYSALGGTGGHGGAAKWVTDEPPSSEEVAAEVTEKYRDRAMQIREFRKLSLLRTMSPNCATVHDRTSFDIANCDECTAFTILEAMSRREKALQKRREREGIAAPRDFKKGFKNDR